jgi:hypothetical protein
MSKALVREGILKIEEVTKFDEANKGKPWTDNELRIVLLHAPTKDNCRLLARAFKRGYGSVEQIVRWAAEDEKAVAEKRPDDSFIQQIKRVAKEVGWRAT